jgi:hypothetical protein
MQNEVWKPVKNYEELYEVSNMGRVRSKPRTFERKHPVNANMNQIVTYKPILIKFHITNNGYCRLGLYKNGVKNNHQIHRLVADAFLINNENKEQVNHKNGIKCDNRVDNLEWVTYYENRMHSYQVLGNIHHNIR